MINSSWFGFNVMVLNSGFSLVFLVWATTLFVALFLVTFNYEGGGNEKVTDCDWSDCFGRVTASFKYEPPKYARNVGAVVEGLWERVRFFGFDGGQVLIIIAFLSFCFYVFWEMFLMEFVPDKPYVYPKPVIPKISADFCSSQFNRKADSSEYKHCMDFLQKELKSLVKMAGIDSSRIR